MTQLKYALPSLGEIHKGLKIWQFIQANSKFNTRIYFDSSGLIDMLTGVNSVYRGGVFKDDLYEKPYNLVYSLAYQGWLGDIYTLPPHTEELLESIQFNTRLFPKNKVSDAKRQANELWTRLLETDDLSEFNKLIKERNSQADSDTLLALQKKPYHTFLGMYLTQHQNNWKLRYRYLVKEKQLFKFSHETDFGTKNVAKTGLFKKALALLNEKRNRTANNYIDALALCTLNERLKDCTTTNVIPFFFCDQEHIIDVANKLSKHPLKDGTRPFIFIDPESKTEFSIVQDASFFIIEGFVKAMKDNNDTKALNKFNDAITQIESPHNNERIKKAKDDIRLDIHELMIVEFFERWWKNNGSKALIEALELKENIPNSTLDKEIKEHLDKTRAVLQSKIIGFGVRFQIIKLAWEELVGFQDLMKIKANNLTLTINAHDDFGTRFNFPIKVCDKIQAWYDNAVDDVKNLKKGGNKDLFQIQSDVIADLMDGLFDNDPDETKNNLDKLIAGIGFFYSFRKFEFVRKVCSEIRRQFEQPTKGKNSADRYPSPSIALIHASTLFLGRPKDPNLENEKVALSIIDCVQSKTEQNYRVWIGLSYVYNLLWEYRIKGYKFKEQYYSQEDYEKEITSSVGLNYIKNALFYSKKAVDFLDTVRIDETKRDPKKHDNRLGRYYYALNNYLFFNTFYTTPKEFSRFKPLAEKLRDISYDNDQFQEGRFSDTLARYYFRSAVLSNDEAHFSLYIKEAIKFCKRSLKSPSNDGLLYNELDSKLEWMKVKGFSEAVIMRERHHQPE